MSNLKLASLIFSLFFRTLIRYQSFSPIINKLLSLLDAHKSKNTAPQPRGIDDHEVTMPPE